MKRSFIILIGFVLGCLLARLTWGAEIYVQCEESPNPIGGYEFQAHDQATNTPPVPPIIFRVKQPAIPLEVFDAKLTVGKRYLVFARALGGEESVTNATHGVIKRYVADTPLGKPFERYLPPPVNAHAIKVQYATNLTSIKIGTNWFDMMDAAVIAPTNVNTFLKLVP